MNIFNKFRTGLNKSSNFFKSNIINSLKSNKITSEDIENIESILISGDVGIDATNELISKEMPLTHAKEKLPYLNDFN